MIISYYLQFYWRINKDSSYFHIVNNPPLDAYTSKSENLSLIFISPPHPLPLPCLRRSGFAQAGLRGEGKGEGLFQIFLDRSSSGALFKGERILSLLMEHSDLFL